MPRLAKTLIEMGLRQEGVAQYKQMLETTDGKYTAGQFLAAGDALLEAKGWDVAGEAYTKSIELTKAVTNESAKTAIIARATLGQAQAAAGQKLYAEAHQKLDQFVEKYAKSKLVIDAYELIVEVASEEGRVEKDDELRKQYFNAAVRAIKRLRGHCKTQAEIDELDLRSGDVLVRKMEAEEAMNLKDKAKETCGLAANAFIAFLMSHEPTAGEGHDACPAREPRTLLLVRAAAHGEARQGADGDDPQVRRHVHGAVPERQAQDRRPERRQPGQGRSVTIRIPRSGEDNA